ncbi:cytochrome c4 [Aestuariicella hydrocarbonica]|uniref:Cytochrome c4 n=1 Tax=Pseudomaricurvus hydrocarbonicus TaxID=1470433 RepID=A0A9E5T4H5_9GAMM|nr:c-type cytochrome [Aestuariicella hydrocarbonica]NHO67969.1 cytochrome c4 [Aestuariicella hydrocarbonica]
MKNIFKQAMIAVSLIAAAQGALAAGDATAGESKVAVCAACHGADGNSPAPNFPKLAGLGEKYLLKQLKDIKAGNRTVTEMVGLLDAMSDQDLADMAAFFDSKPLQLAGAQPLTVKVNSGIEVDGLELAEKIFRAGKADVGTPACTGCHSPRAQGNAPAGYPRLSGQHAQYLETQLRNFRAGERTNDGDQSTMRQVAQHLSDAEIKALANYISGLN